MVALLRRLRRGPSQILPPDQRCRYWSPRITAHTTPESVCPSPHSYSHAATPSSKQTETNADAAPQSRLQHRLQLTVSWLSLLLQRSRTCKSYSQSHRTPGCASRDTIESSNHTLSSAAHAMCGASHHLSRRHGCPSISASRRRPSSACQWRSASSSLLSSLGAA